MSIVQRFKAAKKAFSESGASFLVDKDGRSWNLNSTEFERFWKALQGEYTDTNLVELFHSIPEIYAPIHEIASRVSDAIFELKMFKNDQVVYDDADFNRLFSTPNVLMSFKKFIYQAVCYELVTGKQYFYFNVPDTLSFDYKNVAAWWNLPAHRTTIRRPSSLRLFSATEQKDVISDYVVEGMVNPIKPDKVLAMHQINLGWELGNLHFLTGKSPLLSATKAIVNLIAVYEARNIIYVKRGALGIVVSKKGDGTGLISLTSKEKEALIKEFDGKYGITSNSQGKKKSPIAISDAPIDFIRVAMSIQELQPFDETLADACAIYAALRVPPHLIPSKDRSTFNNQKGDMKGFYQDVIIPIAKQYAEAFTNFFKLTNVRRYIDVNFSHIDILQEDKKDKALVDKTNGETYFQRFSCGVCTLNDWRVATGLEKINEPIYEKLLFQMDDTELAKVSAVLKLKSTSLSVGQQDQNNNNSNSNNTNDNANAA
jgi:hypothetical protein